MAADTGCKINLADSGTPLLPEQPTPDDISITSASHHSMHSISKGHLPFNLPRAATGCHRVPKLHAPLSIGQACDSNCTAVFTSTKTNLLQAKPIFTGYRAQNGLWLVPLPTTETTPAAHPNLQLCNSAYTQTNTKALTLFLHASLGYPPTKILCQAINKGFLATFPGLHSSTARKHIHHSIPTIMGRLTRTQGGLRSTSLPIKHPPTLDAYDPPPMLSNKPKENTKSAQPFSNCMNSRA